LGHLIKGSGVGERAAAAGGVAGETVKIVINLGDRQFEKAGALTIEGEKMEAIT
jgi:hypothetical protein